MAAEMGRCVICAPLSGLHEPDISYVTNRHRFVVSDFHCCAVLRRLLVINLDNLNKKEINKQ